MMKKVTNWLAVLCGLTMCLGAVPSQAAISQLDSTTDDLTVMGYTNTGSGGALVAKTPVWYSGGYGVISNSADAGTPQHAVDNNGFKEALLLDFGASTRLDSVTIGYRSNDSDITVLAWTGLPNQSAPVFNSTTTYGNLTSLGWSLVGHYANLATGTAKAVNVVNPVSSSFWLVMAYNNAFGSTRTDTASSYSGLGGGNDYVKFLSVSYTTTTPPDHKVPEPSTALLIGAAMFGLVGWRNRRTAAR